MDERLAAAWLDWWWNEPTSGDDLDAPSTPETALHDLRTLIGHLEANGFRIEPVDNGHAIAPLSPMQNGSNRA